MGELIAGIKHIRDGLETQTSYGAEMSVVGLIGTAPDADAAAFPLNTAVYLTTSDVTLRAKLGAAGTLEAALVGISAQAAGSTRSVKVVVVRVDTGADAFETIGNIIGDEALGTGMWAFLGAPYDLGVTPRLIIAPGFTSQSNSGVDSVSIDAAGASGTDGVFDLVFSGGTGSGAAGTFVVSGGSVTSIAITAPGSYTVAPDVAFTESANLAGATGTVTLAQLANGVCAAIPTILERLKAVFVPEGPATTKADFINWLETIPASERILHPLNQVGKIVDSAGDTVTVPLSPYIIGLYPRVDSERDGVPSKSAANRAIYGLVGVSPTIPFSITDENSVGQEYLAISAGLVVRGDIGVEDSLSDGGLTFWGTDTLTDGTDWLFSHVVRLRDYIELMQVKTEKYYLGKFNITVQTVQAVINTLNTLGRNLVADGDILDFRTVFDESANTPAELRNGELDIIFKCEEPPVLRKLIIRSRRYAEALTNLTKQISRQIGVDTAA